MPNGRPGDHPYTDIVVHGRRVYSPAIDDLVREVDVLSDERGRNDLAALLMHEYNEHSHPDLSKLLELLTAKRDRLHEDATRRGWEV
jgi:hypothetical protein